MTQIAQALLQQIILDSTPQKFLSAVRGIFKEFETSQFVPYQDLFRVLNKEATKLEPASFIIDQDDEVVLPSFSLQNIINPIDLILIRVIATMAPIQLDEKIKICQSALLALVLQSQPDWIEQFDKFYRYIQSSFTLEWFKAACNQPISLHLLGGLMEALKTTWACIFGKKNEESLLALANLGLSQPRFRFYLSYLEQTPDFFDKLRSHPDLSGVVDTIMTKETVLYPCKEGLMRLLSNVPTDPAEFFNAVFYLENSEMRQGLLNKIDKISWQHPIKEKVKKLINPHELKSVIDLYETIFTADQHKMFHFLDQLEKNFKIEKLDGIHRLLERLADDLRQLKSHVSTSVWDWVARFILEKNVQEVESGLSHFLALPSKFTDGDANRKNLMSEVMMGFIKTLPPEFYSEVIALYVDQLGTRVDVPQPSSGQDVAGIDAASDSMPAESALGTKGTGGMVFENYARFFIPSPPRPSAAAAVAPQALATISVNEMVFPDFRAAFVSADPKSERRLSQACRTVIQQLKQTLPLTECHQPVIDLYMQLLSREVLAKNSESMRGHQTTVAEESRHSADRDTGVASFGPIN